MINTEILTPKGGRDKIQCIEEYHDKIILIMADNAGTQARPIEVPMTVINFVKREVEKHNVGYPFPSKVIQNKYIKEFKIPSKIIDDRLPVIERVLKIHNMNPLLIENVIYELKEDDYFYLMSWEENIGSRKTGSIYFQLYAALRYIEEKGMIQYSASGQICRIE